jgi:Transcriptional regulator
MRHEARGLRGEAESSSERQILDAALALFAEKGFHGSSVREVALRAGVSVAGLYHHFPSKGQLLEQLIDETMDALIVTTTQALQGHENDPVASLSAVVSAHVRFHIEFQRQSFVGNTELRSLVSPARERILRKRDRQSAFFDAAVTSGLEAGVFSVANPAEAARAIVTMCTAVATWFRHGRQLSADEVVGRYCALSLLMVGSREPPCASAATQASNNNQEAK